MKLWKGHLWSRSYCLLTTGQTTLDVLKRYVESQGENVICEKQKESRIEHCSMCGW
jgi:REP element-mobilizing transposase RayT